MIRRLSLVTCVVMLGMSLSSIASASVGPRGAVVLKSSALLKVGSTQCGKVNGSWISGKVTKIKSKNYFVSYVKSSQLYASDAKRSKGSQKKRLLKLGSDFKVKASRGDKNCSRYNPSVLVVTTLPVSTTVPVATTVMVTTTTVPPAKQALKFDFSEAAVLAVVESKVTTSGVHKLAVESNLKGIRSDGSIFDAISSGEVSVRSVVVAPADNIYVLFKSPASIQGESCILVNVDRKTGIPICVERDATFLQTSFRYSNNKIEDYIQFDSNGAIYYAGVPNRTKIGSKDYFNGWTCCNESMTGAENLIVRRWKSGKITDFGYGAQPGIAANQPELRDMPAGFSSNPLFSNLVGIQEVTNQYIGKFVISPDGHIFIDQSTGWIMKSWGGVGIEWKTVVYSPAGEYRVIVTNHKCEGRVAQRCNNYYLISSLTNGVITVDCVDYYQVSTGGIDGRGAFCDIDTSTWSVSSPRIGEWVSVCSTLSGPNPWLPLLGPNRWFTYMCGDAGVIWRHSWKSPSGKTYALVGGEGFCIYLVPCRDDQAHLDADSTGVVIEVSPNLSITRLSRYAPNSVLDNVEVALPILDSVVASGPTKYVNDDKSPTDFKTVLLNLATNISRDLIPTSANIRVKTLAYVPSTNIVMFSGVKTGDGSSVFGSVDLVSGRIVQSSGMAAGVLSMVGLDR
jgi:hypothetical protein